ncbi:TPA: branched-chain amino acid ABC transporter permease [Candidatus Bathyarchaeota archaeon]|nr:branched-chain amino acid ABC transporter permease [Candidatus Bathyarchaeota archaeon]
MVIDIEILSKLIFGVMNGFVWGLIIMLIALGLSLILGLMFIVNVAHGEFYMLGAVATWFIVNYFGNFWLALALAPLIVGTIGLASERGILRKLIGNPEMTIVATFGLAFIFQQIGLMLGFGIASSVPNPTPFTVKLPVLSYPGYRFVAAGIASAILFSLYVFLHRTKLGLWVRASRQDVEMAQCLGIPVSRVYAFVFFLGTFLAGIGGTLASPLLAVEYLMGLDALILAFIIVIVGGLGSLKGTVVAAILIAEVEGIGSVFLSPTEARVLSLLVLIAVVLVRPRGLFGVWGE